MVRKRYSEEHWIRSPDATSLLTAYAEQQNKAYSKTKNQFIKELLGNLNGKRFLDYGCGAGMFVIHAAREGASNIIGVDTEETALSAVRLFAGNEGVSDRLNLILSETFPDLPPPVDFDTILMKDVIEHVEDDEALLQAASRSMKPGGIIVISTQNALSLNYMVEGGYNRLIKGKKDWYGWDKTHLRFYTPATLSLKLRRSGFEPAVWRSSYIIPHKFKAPRLSGKEFYRIEFLTAIDRTLGRIFPFNIFGWNIMVKAYMSPTALPYC